MSVDRLLRRANSTPQFTASVVVPAPAFRPKKHQGGRALTRSVCRFSTRRGSANRAVEGVLCRGPCEEFVRPRAHRLEDQIRIRRLHDRKNPRMRRRGTEPLDRRHRPQRIGSDVDDDEVRRGGIAGLTVGDDTDRNRSRSQEVPHLLSERIIFTDDESDELCHGYSTKRMTTGNAPGAGPAPPT